MPTSAEWIVVDIGQSGSAAMYYEVSNEQVDAWLRMDPTTHPVIIVDTPSFKALMYRGGPRGPFTHRICVRQDV